MKFDIGPRETFQYDLSILSMWKLWVGELENGEAIDNGVNQL